MSLLRYKTYLHGSKEQNYGLASDFGLADNERFVNKFVYSLYEVDFDMDVDTNTGESWIVAVNGVRLENPVKA
jgi:hypothetical protein